MFHRKAINSIISPHYWAGGAFFLFGTLTGPRVNLTEPIHNPTWFPSWAWASGSGTEATTGCHWCTYVCVCGRRGSDTSCNWQVTGLIPHNHHWRQKSLSRELLSCHCVGWTQDSLLSVPRDGNKDVFLLVFKSCSCVSHIGTLILQQLIFHVEAGNFFMWHQSNLTNTHQTVGVLWVYRHRHYSFSQSKWKTIVSCIID